MPVAFVAKAGTALRAGRAALPRIPGPTRPWGLRPVSQPPARSGLNLPAPLNAALGGLLLCLLAGPLSAAWTWSTRSSGGDLWLTAAQDGAPLFDLRLGAGGAIAELDYRPAAGADLLANPYGDNDTDRVIQWTLWSDSYAVATPSGSDLRSALKSMRSPLTQVTTRTEVTTTPACGCALPAPKRRW